MSNLSTLMYELFFDSQRTSRHDAVFLSVFDDNYVICTTVVPHRIKSVYTKKQCYCLEKNTTNKVITGNKRTDSHTSAE